MARKVSLTLKHDVGDVVAAEQNDREYIGEIGSIDIRITSRYRDPYVVYCVHPFGHKIARYVGVKHIRAVELPPEEEQ